MNLNTISLPWEARPKSDEALHAIGPFGKGITRMWGCTQHSGHLSCEPLIPVRPLGEGVIKTGAVPAYVSCGAFFLPLT